MSSTRPPSPEELYDDTIALAWRLACCLHRDQRRAEDALERAYVEVSRTWPSDLVEARIRLLALLCDQAGRRAHATPAA